MLLESKSYQGMKSTSPLLNSGLATWHTWANRMLVEVTACQLQAYRPFTFPLTLLELCQPCENKQTSLLQYEGPTGKALSHSRWSHIRPVSQPTCHLIVDQPWMTKASWDYPGQTQIKRMTEKTHGLKNKNKCLLFYVIGCVGISSVASL